MKLADVDAVRGRMGVNANVVNTSAVEAALEAATPIIEGILGTPLEKRDTLDFFDYRPSKYSDPANFVSLRLVCDRGLFRDPPKVYLSDDGSELTGPDTSLLLADTEYTYDTEQGVVDLLTIPKRGAFTILVAYTAGFSDEDTLTPNWLREAAISSAIAQTSAFGVQHNKKDLRDNIPYQNAAVRANLHRYIRTRQGISPSSSRKA